MVMNAVAIKRDMVVPSTIHQAINPTAFDDLEVSIHTSIGGRKHQEDRFTVCPTLVAGKRNCAFFGVFDGTVGHFASENVKDLVVPHLVGTPAWQELVTLVNSNPSQEVLRKELPPLLSDAIEQMYINSDNELVSMCEVHKKDYASSTSVVAVMVCGFLGVGHLGDSRVAIGMAKDGGVVSSFLTVDHKPDHPIERERILLHGGSVEYLCNHSNKPFIRGGDFHVRKSRGEQPMQLQYSRAFGGKDLKMFGLSNKPDISILELNPNHQVIVLASDGLWDVQSAENAVNGAIAARKNGQNPSEFLVGSTLREQESRSQSADNITAMTVFINVK